MAFIKNKTTNQSKLLLTSSVLILNGNMCDLANSRPKPGQQFLKQTTTNSRLIMAKQKDSEIDEILHDLGEVSSKLKKLKKRLPTGNLPIYEGDESGYESDSESESESESIYEEINYAKIDPNKNNKQPYKNHTKSDWDEGYSSGSGRANHSDQAQTSNHTYDSVYEPNKALKDSIQKSGSTANHSDQALKDSIQKSGNNNDSNVHFYETIPPITADEYINGKEKSDTKYEEKGYHQIDGNYNDTKEPIYEDPIDFKNNSQPETSSHTYDSVYEPNNEEANGFIETREAIKPIRIMRNLKCNPNDVHKHIPNLKECRLIELVEELENIINDMVAIRRDNDHLLTEEQKTELATLKTKIRVPESACNNVINFYNNNMSKLLDGPITITKKAAKTDKKEIENMAKETNNLLKNAKKLRKSIPVTDL